MDRSCPSIMVTDGFALMLQLVILMANGLEMINGYGIREVHTNSVEGMGTDVRNFLRPFKGFHKGYLSGYVAMPE